MELAIKCESWNDQCSLVYELVGDDFSFSFDASTGEIHIPAESKEAAQEMVTRRFSLYDLESAYTCTYLGGTEIAILETV